MNTALLDANRLRRSYKDYARIADIKLSPEQQELKLNTPLIEANGLCRSFGGVAAVDDVSLSLNRGEVVALLGHNGAGKSTLIKMLSGVVPIERGEIRVNGEVAEIKSPRDAQALGIETIFQTLALADNLDAVSNLFLGREIKRRFGFLNREEMEKRAEQTLNRMNLRIPSLNTLVRSMSGGQRQAVAIARAIYFNAKVLIMDEPTAALGPEETRQVGLLIKELTSQGIGIFLISHDINDVFELSNRITVMKGGRVVDTCYTKDVTKDDVLEMIILGRPVTKH